MHDTISFAALALKSPGTHPHHKRQSLARSVKNANIVNNSLYVHANTPLPPLLPLQVLVCSCFLDISSPAARSPSSGRCARAGPPSPSSSSPSASPAALAGAYQGLQPRHLFRLPGTLGAGGYIYSSRKSRQNTQDTSRVQVSCRSALMHSGEGSWMKRCCPTCGSREIVSVYKRESR